MSCFCSFCRIARLTRKTITKSFRFFILSEFEVFLFNAKCSFSEMSSWKDTEKSSPLSAIWLVGIMYVEIYKTKENYDNFPSHISFSRTILEP